MAPVVWVVYVEGPAGQPAQVLMFLLGAGDWKSGRRGAVLVSLACRPKCVCQFTLLTLLLDA